MTTSRSREELEQELADKNREARLLELALQEAGIRLIPMEEPSHDERVFQIAVAILEARARKAGDIVKVTQVTRTRNILRRAMRTSDIREVRRYLERHAVGQARPGIGIETIKVMQEIVDASVIESPKRKRRLHG